MEVSEPIHVLIADDQELVRTGFSMVIGSQPDMKVVGLAADGQQAVEMAHTLHPDVTLMDVRMPGVDGITATGQITDANTQAMSATRSENSHDVGETPHGNKPMRVIILTTFDLDEYVMAAINAGASGFLLKDTEPETLLNSIRTVFQGNAIIAPTATKRLIEKMMEDGYTQEATAATDEDHRLQTASSYSSSLSSPAQAVAQHSHYTDPELDALTDREREVLVEIAAGLSNQEIADKLFISLPTVKTHVAHILAKINARDRVQAVVFAYDNGLVKR